MKPPHGLAAFFVLVAPALAQTTWYVDPAATPPYDGTPAHPFAAIQDAIDAPAVEDGDTILAAPGTYVEAIEISKDVTVRSASGPLVTTLRPPTATATAVLVSSVATGIQGFTIERGTPTPAGIGFRVPVGTSCRLLHCIVIGHEIGILNDYDAFVDQCTVTLNERGVDALDNQAIHWIGSSIVRGNFTSDLTVPPLAWMDVQYSNVTLSGSCQCSGEFSDDPRFYDAAGDFHLRPDSPCIDSGDPLDPLDPDGSRADVGALTFDAYYAPGTSTTCFGSAALCPCGNGGSGSAGCDIVQGTGGIAIAVRNFTPDGAGGGTAEIVGTGYPPASQPSATLIRSPSAEDPPVVFGDGLRCIASSGLVRISAVLAQGGTSVSPVSHGAGAGTFHYQLWVRNTPATFCDASAAFNLSSALTIAWP